MTLVAIHQPNYVPWLGYFRKIAETDVFVLLDDVQFPKGSYTNRVQILANGAPRWLSIPTAARLGEAINQTRPARDDWVPAHLDAMRTFYGSATSFADAWPRVRDIYQSIPRGSLADINRHLILAVADTLALGTQFLQSSQIQVAPDLRSDDRLVALVAAIDPRGSYVSGKGGAKYQDPAKFAAAGLGFRYTDFRHPQYAQGAAPFVAGLSVLDAVFWLGWQPTAQLIAHAGDPA